MIFTSVTSEFAANIFLSRSSVRYGGKFLTHRRDDGLAGAAGSAGAEELDEVAADDIGCEVSLF